ncbi:MAG: hypothetical protein EPO25_12560 [Gammaproteobacteria bacterium]|jgi:hypothetical protein|nr:MAG: hypothetical protein EPO25_12560 [Gammaproteobacteria bacterium]
MDTMRLKTLNNPRQTQVLLEGCLAVGRPALPTGSCRIQSPEELPPELQRHAESRLGSDGVWLAWSDRRRIWFFTGEPSLALSRERKQPVLNVREYDERGELLEAANWVLTNLGGWQRLGP